MLYCKFGYFKGLFTIELSLGLVLFEFWRHLLGQLRADSWHKNSNCASLSPSSIANNPLGRCIYRVISNITLSSKYWIYHGTTFLEGYEPMLLEGSKLNFTFLSKHGENSEKLSHSLSLALFTFVHVVRNMPTWKLKTKGMSIELWTYVQQQNHIASNMKRTLKFLHFLFRTLLFPLAKIGRGNNSLWLF